MTSATILSIIVSVAVAFSTEPRKNKGACVGALPAEVQAAAQAFLDRYTEAELAQAEAELAQAVPKNCAEVLDKGFCGNAFAAGVACCECGDPTDLNNLEFAVSAEMEGGSSQDDCHPAASMVELEGGRMEQISKVAQGDYIRTPSGFEPITAFVHNEADVAWKYMRFETAAGKTLHIAPRHHLFANGREVAPTQVKIGDELHLSNKSTTAVTAISIVVAQGAYHLFTPSGSYYVDGLLASDYYECGYSKRMYDAGRYYMAARMRMGLWVKQDGVVKVVDVMTAFRNAPAWVRPVAMPLLWVTSFLAELLNCAAELATPVTAAVIATGVAMLLVSRKGNKAAKTA